MFNSTDYPRGTVVWENPRITGRADNLISGFWHTRIILNLTQAHASGRSQRW